MEYVVYYCYVYDDYNTRNEIGGLLRGEIIMALPTSYMTGSFTKIPQYFETLLTAKAPDKFTVKFMTDLGYTSSNDRQFVNVLKAIGFIDEGGTPTTRYYHFLDQSKAKLMVAEGIRDAYADLFMLNISANKLTKDEVMGKFKTLTNGSKENVTISYMASTFVNLCAYADWTQMKQAIEATNQPITGETPPPVAETDKSNQLVASGGMFDLNYNIHIHLPVTRDEGVYDALFASLAKHINSK
jgi:hypothetical protein